MIKDSEVLWPQQRALKELASLGLRYAVIRQPISWEIAGDIDIIVLDINKFDQTLKKNGYIRFSNSYINTKYIKFDSLSRQWIHLDVQTIIKFNKIEAPRNFIESLLEEAIINDEGIPCLNYVDESILIILHLAIEKNSFDPKYMARIIDMDARSIMSHAEKYSFLPEPPDFYVKVFECYRRGKINEQEAIVTIRSSFKLDRSNYFFWKRIIHRLRRLWMGTCPVVFLGPDGAGKSALSESLSHLRWPPIRLQYMGPARESEICVPFIILLRIFGKLREKFSKKHLFGIVARAAWQVICYLDFLVRVWRHHWFTGSGGVVIYDRYACDIYFRKPTIWNEFLFLRMFPRPVFVFLCVGDAELIYKRKPEELSVKNIVRTIELYKKKLIQYMIPFVEVDTTQYKEEENLKQIVRRLIEQNWFRYR